MVEVLKHPLITHKLTQMRSVETEPESFRRYLKDISSLMIYEVCKDLPTKEVSVITPKGICSTEELSKSIVVVPILRAGIGFVDGILDVLPEAKVGFVGLYRDEDSSDPQVYYSKFPDMEDEVVIIVDPTLATGSSAIEAANMIKRKGAKDIKMMCLVAAPEGIKALAEAHPDIDIYAAALDDRLDENGYIVPGLGDVGDRLYGTK